MLKIHAELKKKKKPQEIDYSLNVSSVFENNSP